MVVKCSMVVSWCGGNEYVMVVWLYGDVVVGDGDGKKLPHGGGTSDGRGWKKGENE